MKFAEFNDTNNRSTFLVEYEIQKRLDLKFL